jgi:hypothetical protein
MLARWTTSFLTHL